VGTSLGSEACWIRLATLSSCSTRSRSRSCCSRRTPLSSERLVLEPHCSVILPPFMRWMTMGIQVSSLPLGATPISFPRSWVRCTMQRLTTLSPWTIWSSTTTLRLEKAAEIWAIAHFSPSRPGCWSGRSLVWVTKLGAIMASIASRSPLALASQKRRTNAMFSSADIEVLLATSRSFSNGPTPRA
jgi:hypothetical protein